MLGGGLGLSDFCIPMLRRAGPKNSIRQSTRPLSRIGDQVHLGRNTAYLSRINIDANQLQTRRAVPPANVEQFEPRTDDHSHVSLGPKLCTRSDGEAERMVVGNNTTAAAEADHRGAQHFGQLIDLSARLKRAGADENHRSSRLA
ncbi:hypothetical protein D9M68_931040 [compost metagenome]